MRTASDPEFHDRRMRAIKCRKCDSTDVWRIQTKDNLFSRMFHRGLKQFQCRACRYCFYHHARRRSDLLAQENPALPRDRRVRIALVVAVLVSVVAFSSANWLLRRAARNRAARLRLSQAALVANRVQAKPYSVPMGRNAVAAEPVGEIMTNEDVMKLKQAGLADGVIIAKMRSVHCEYKLATSDIVVLKQAGFSDNLIAAMLQAMRFH
ncbi:MAG: hypothetical protein ABUS49_08115 [Acidobacteriota bacterium]